MSEEPRRSGRATKGVHTKIQEDPPTEAAVPKPKKKSKQEQKEEEIIRCICDENEDSGEAFISCDNCGVWQHNDCMGLSIEEEDLPDKYFCEQCRPGDHKELLEAMARGERPWEAAAARRKEEAAKSKGKKGKNARTSKAKEADSKATTKSASPAASKPQDTPTPAGLEKGKRKLAIENGADAEEQPSKVRRSSTYETKDKPRQSKRKSESVAVSPEAAQVSAPDPDAMVNFITELQDQNRKGCANLFRSKFEAKIKDLCKQGEYQILDGDTAASLAESWAIAVEHAMFKNHVGPGPKPDFSGTYKQQMTTIGSNIVLNSTLMLRLLSQSLTADELSTMSSDNMASEELQRKMASMKEEVEKQSTLVSDDLNRPLVRRTHKGEELVDDQSNQVSSESIVSAAPIRRRESNLEGLESPTVPQPKSPDVGPPDGRSPNATGTPLTIDTNRPIPTPTGDVTRRSSSNFDIKNVWSSVQSPEIDQAPRFPSKPPPQDAWSTPSHPDRKPKSENDPDIDRLLEEEDGTESPPYSPGEFTGPTIIWRGIVDMPITGGSVARFKAFAQHVAGSDLKNKVDDLSSIYPESLELSGRIPKDKADEYLTSLSASRSTDVSVHSLKPVDSEQSNSRAEFDKLFKYFIDRNRYGVVADAHHRNHVSDMYLIPLEAGLAKMPPFLERLDFNTIESPPSRPMLLVVFILKWKTGVPPTPAAVNNSESTPAVMSPPGSSVPGAPAAMSPGARSGPQPPQFPPSQQNSFPAYPYTPPPVQLQTPVQQKNLENARHVLADLVNCPTTQQILQMQGEEMGMDLWEKLKTVFTREPAAQNDFGLFQKVLAGATG